MNPPEPVIAQIGRQARLRPEQAAYLCGDEQLTYGELWAGSGRIAAGLRAVMGENPAPVAIHGRKGGWFLTCMLACMRAGKAYLPIDSACPPARVRQILSSAGVKLVLDWETAMRMLEKPEAVEVLRCNTDISYVLYTSGSEGAPKGVRITPENLRSFTEWSRTLADGGIWLNQAPYSFDLSCMAVFPALTGGKTLCDLDASLPFGRMFNCLGASGVAVWVSTPSFAAYCLSDRSFGRALLPELNTFLFCGEALSPQLVRGLFERFPDVRVVNAYGPTEAAVAVTAVEITSGMCAGLLPVGQPKPGTQIVVADGSLRPLPDGQTGQIVILGDSVGAGYIGEDPNRKFRLFDGVPAYLTGDLGFFRDGMLYVAGRMDGMLKYRGFRVEPSEVEAALLSIGGVSQAAVLPEYADGEVRSLTAFLCGERRESLWVRRALREQLPAYMIPKRIVWLSEMPLAGNGKLDKGKLRGML